MKHWHIKFQRNRAYRWVSHSHSGGHKWHEHSDKSYEGYGRTKDSYRVWH